MSFNGDRLRILRRFHNLTQRNLGELIGSSASAITAYERGQSQPKGLTLDALAAALQVESDYFLVKEPDDEFREHETNFRSLVATPDRLRKKVLAHATLFGFVLELLTTKVRPPRLKLPQLEAKTLADIEQAAELCRVEWGVGVDAPIHNVTQMIEHAGIVVTVLDSEISKKVDAFSRYGATNLVVLNPAKGSASRTRFDLTHEAGHGSLHRGKLIGELRLREEQANYFASAVLLPQKTFAREFWSIGKVRHWEHLVDLKVRWGASLAAIVTRSYHLGLIDAAEYRRRFKYMNRVGWLRGEPEPGEPNPESPQLFSLMLRRYLAETRKTTLAIASDLKWSPELFRQVTGIDPTGGPETRSDGPHISEFEEYRLKKLAAS